MAILSVSNLCKSYGADEILTDISFLVEQKDKIGLVGLNGAGKSTLLKVLAGIISKDHGEISAPKDIKIGYLAQETVSESFETVGNALRSIFKETMELEDTLRKLEHKMSLPEIYNDPAELESLMDEYATLSEKFKESGGYEIESRIRGMLTGLGFGDEDFPITALSGGQKTRLALARLLLTSPDLLLLDEPTNYLDTSALEWLEGFLKDYPKALIIASHDRYLLDNVANLIFELENHYLYSYRGNYSEFIRQKRHKMKVQKKHDEILQEEIDKLKDNIERFTAHRKYSQAESRRKRLEELLPKSVEKIDIGELNINFASSITSGKEVVIIEDLSFSYGEKQLLKGENLKVFRGERIGIVGPNGIGKSTLLNLINGTLEPDEGKVVLGHQVKPVLFDQEQRDLDPENTVLEEVWQIRPDLKQTQIRTFLAKFLFFGEDVDKTINQLSGGQRSRVALAKVVLQGGNLLLLDEPTNYLDIMSKEILEDALLDYDGTIIVISHDRYFLSKIPTRIWEFTEEGIRDFAGEYAYYLEKRKPKIQEPQEAGKTKTQLQKEKLAERKIREKKRRYKRKLQELEEEILQKEEELEQVEKLLCNPKLYDNPEKIKELSLMYDNIIKTLEELYENLDEF